MKVLWVCNKMPGTIAEVLGAQTSPFGGWLDGLSHSLIQSDKIELRILFGAKQTYTYEGGKLSARSFPFKQNAYTVPASLIELFAEEIGGFAPDVIHIFGCEYRHTNAAAQAAHRLGLSARVVISIQGLCSIYAEHMTAGLPFWAVHGRTLLDIKRGSSVAGTQRLFRKKGKLETEALQSVPYISGRTDWDYACTTLLAPQAKYLHGEETLRKVFYESRWSEEACIPHSIFVSQGGYSIKGFHFVLDALVYIRAIYPKVCVYVTGEDISGALSAQQYFRLSWYQRYLRKKIRKLSLQNSIHYVGQLDAKEMRDTMLQSNVFLSPSLIENSSNAIGEAMILGMPVVASDVGGTASLVTHDRNGLLYPADAPYMLAFRVMQVFKENGLANRLGDEAVKSAQKRYDVEQNLYNTLEMYSHIEQQAKQEHLHE